MSAHFANVLLKRSLGLYGFSSGETQSFTFSKMVAFVIKKGCHRGRLEIIQPITHSVIRLLYLKLQILLSRGRSRVSRKGVLMYTSSWVRFVDFISLFLKYPMKIK